MQEAPATSSQEQAKPTTRSSDFAQEAERGSRGVVGEMFDFLKYTKKWWMAPIIIALLGLGVVAYLSSSVAAPLIYTLF